ncbi:restriction endonuclease subunit S [Megasphaera elsdenii]|uniref:restriction endonuclease subunit S n=1 Tax=Megasphaera elsdenii TaxID=907 RepID=UPI0022DF9FEE|nr:restriction endonuclease subunit S [Megasphaera elsdenii]
MKLNDVCEFIIDCPHSTAKDEGKGYPLIRTPNIGKGRLILDGVYRVSDTVYKSRIQRGVPQDGDLIFAREAPAGNVAIITNGEKVCLGQRTVLIRPNKSLVDAKWLVYYLLSPQKQYDLLGTANGATVAHVNLPTIRNLNIKLPDMVIQNKIASILSTYDDLIENNRCQIALLEEAASRLYKEWFVDFHFPGHEQVKIVDGVPEGWSKKQLCEIATIFSGYPFSSKTMNKEGKYKIITIKNIQDGRLDSSSVDCIDSIPDNMPDYCKLNEKDILLSMTGNVGRVCIFFGKNCLLNQRVAKITGSNLGYLYCLFRSPDMYNKICNLSNGVAQQNLSLTRIRKTQILFPAKNIREVFEKNIIPMINQILTVSKQNRLLQEARDRLLPKLMNGEIEVRP